eukprot:scaffold4149_cov224-Chaetoceros_neogracile.AAC.1
MVTTTKRTYEEGPGCDTSGNEKGSKVWTIAILNEFGQECDDEIQVPNKTSLIDFVSMLCNGPVKERREQDHEMHAHLWDLKIIPAELSTEKSQEVVCPPGVPYYIDRDTLDPDTLFENLKALDLQGTLCLKYDYGSPTVVTMKVQSVSFSDLGKEDEKHMLQLRRNKGVPIQGTGGDIVKDDSQKELSQNEISIIPAHDLPLSKQIDVFYPEFSKAIIDNSDYDEVRAFTLGLSKRVDCETDTTFSTMELYGIDDAFDARLPWDNMDDFLDVAEEVWSKKVSRRGKTTRLISPPTADGKESYDEQKEWYESLSGFLRRLNGDRVFLRKSREEIENARNEKKKTEGKDVFDFATTFPRTAGQLTSGKFRWFRYETHGLLKVVVGRGLGINHRTMKEEQTLRICKRKFASFHELLCAVEASWVYPGSCSTSSPPQYLSTDTFLPEYDADVSPSNPRPVAPPILSKKDDSIDISKAKVLAPVTALAIAPEGETTTILYSGHRNGEVRKWNLETNKQIWKKQVFQHPDESYDTFLLGIRGIAVQELPSGEHLIYTWSHTYDSIECNLPNEVRVLNGRNGQSHHVLKCQVDCDMDRHPLISCVIFSKLMYEDVWDDVVIVGLKVTCECLTYNENYTDFVLEEAEDFAYGNILPFVGEEVEETWRGHNGTIRSMAVTPDRYIVSCSEHNHGFAEAIILWSAKTPGEPLHRIDLFKGNLCHGCLSPPLRSLQGGIAVHGNKILIGGEYGDMIVPIDIVGIDEGGDKKPSLDMRGFGTLGLRSTIDSSLKGCLVGSGNAAIITNEGCEEVYIFPIDSLGDNPHLNNDLSPTDIEKQSEHLDEDDDTHLHVRSMALGQFKFRFQKHDPSKDDENGGPVVLAIKGRYVVAGFDSGGIVRAKLLPEEFDDRSKGSSNMYASSALQRDESLPTHFDEFDHPSDDRPPAIAQQCLIQ